MQSTNGQQEPSSPTATATPTPTPTPIPIPIPIPIPTPTPTPDDPISSKDSLQNDQLPSTTNTHNEDLVDLSPNVQQLALIFPQIQPSILQAVLAAHQDDPAESIPDLLAMSDPSWKPSIDDIVKSDEALARQLAQEEDLHQQTPSQPSQPHQLPYQPRIKKTPPSRIQPRASSPINGTLTESSSSALSPAAKDEIQKMADEFSKMAESGKKTVSTWLSKAKAKLIEMQQPQPDPDDDAHLVPSYQPKHTEGELMATGSEYGSSSITPRSSRISPALPYASRYESMASTNKPQSSTPTALTNTSVASKPSVPPPVEGYHLDENPNPVTGPGIKTVTADATSTPQSAKPLAGPPSKAPISSTRHQTRDDDEESLEYTRNPFEDDD